jgi:hypothetical protein
LTKRKFNVSIKLLELCNDCLVKNPFVRRKKGITSFRKEFISSVYFVMFITKIKLIHIPNLKVQKDI